MTRAASRLIEGYLVKKERRDLPVLLHFCQLIDLMTCEGCNCNPTANSIGDSENEMLSQRLARSVGPNSTNRLFHSIPPLSNGPATGLNRHSRVITQPKDQGASQVNRSISMSVMKMIKQSLTGDALRYRWH